MWSRARRWLTPRYVRALQDRAAVSPDVLHVGVHADYRPHGGSDRIIVEIAADHGSIDRLRTPMARRGSPQRITRALEPDEARRLSARLREIDVFSLSHAHESITDGLSCRFDFVLGKRTHAVRLRYGTQRSQPFDLLELFRQLAPIDLDTPFAFTTSSGEIYLRDR